MQLPTSGRYHLAWFGRAPILSRSGAHPPKQRHPAHQYTCLARLCALQSSNRPRWRAKPPISPGNDAYIHARGRMEARAAKMTHRRYLFAISIDLGSVKHYRAINNDFEGLCVLYRPQIDGGGVGLFASVAAMFRSTPLILVASIYLQAGRSLGSSSDGSRRCKCPSEPLKRIASVAHARRLVRNRHEDGQDRGSVSTKFRCLSVFACRNIKRGREGLFGGTAR